MKLVSCSQCGGLFPLKKTDVVEKKRVCHPCKKSKKEVRLWK
jgi:formylmethanofuran dehydrogenase subunit E